jgi:hypothetical protein
MTGSRGRPEPFFITMPNTCVRLSAGLLVGVLFLTSTPVRVLLFGQCPCGCDHHDEPAVLAEAGDRGDAAASDSATLTGGGTRAPAHHHHHNCDCHNRNRVTEYLGDDGDVASALVPPAGQEQVRVEPSLRIPLPPVSELIRPPRV